jgi:hypothetical protein
MITLLSYSKQGSIKYGDLNRFRIVCQEATKSLTSKVSKSVHILPPVNTKI